MILRYSGKGKAAKPLPSFRKDHIDSITACSVLASSLYEMAGGADRLNCVFRDDLTFLVYLWQRWKYRLDETRMMESSELRQASSRRVIWGSLIVCVYV